MKFKQALIAILLLMVSGCTLADKIGFAEPDKPPPPDVVAGAEGKKDFEDGNHYYMYIESQLYDTYKPDLSLMLLEKAVEKDPSSKFLLRELASFHYRNKNLRESLAITQKLVETDPEDVESLIILGRLMLEMEDNDGAMAAFEKAVVFEPDQQEPYLLLGDIYLEKNELNKAVDLFRDMKIKFPDSYACHYYLGRALAGLGRTDEAEEAFLKTMALNSSFRDGYEELLKVYKIAKKKEKAITLYKRVIEKFPKEMKYPFELGYFYHESEMAEESEILLKSLGERSVSEHLLIGFIIRNYISPKHYDTALAIVRGMLKGAPDCPELHYLMGVIQVGFDNHETAAGHFEKVGPESEFYENAVIHLSYIFEKLGKIQEAIDLLSAAVEDYPDNSEFMLYLGAFYEQVKSYKKAAIVLKKGARLTPGNTDFLFRLGVVYDKMGKKSKSIKYMKKVIDRDPRNANALNYLGYTYADTGRNLDKAEELIKKAMAHKPNDGYITDSLGWVYFKKGLYQKALETLLKAVELVPEDPIILEHLGDVYLKTDNTEKALEFYRKSLMKKEGDKKEIEEKIRDLTEK